MFKLLYKLPEKYWVAVSGGVDSMAALHFLDKPSRRESLSGVVHVNHGTGEYADHAERLVQQHCRDHNIRCLSYKVKGEPPKGESKENWWREQRYGFFKRAAHNEHVILAHNMDDCLEEYIMCTMVRGYASTIPYMKDNCVRPFRLWKREQILRYADQHGVNFATDPSNSDIRFTRNYIRHEIVPKIKRINPGVYRIVERMIDTADTHALESALTENN